MNHSIRKQIKEFLRDAESQYYRLVLLIGKSGSGKTAILQNIAAEMKTRLLNVNVELSERLLELTARQRSLRVPDILASLGAQIPPPLILDNLEILFDTNLQLDPLRLLQSISRNRVVLASWNGTLHAGQLTYAEPDHPEYRRYEQSDALLVEIQGEYTNPEDARRKCNTI